MDNLIAQSAVDPNKDMSEYIKIEIIDRDDEKGFYTIKVKMLKQAPDIIIRPVCIPFPAVEAYYPTKDSEPSYANMGIKITFNMPMESESLSSEFSQFNYNKIFITHNSTDITSYFEEPKFNSEKTVLTLKPKDSFLDYIEATNEVSININVSLADSIVISKNSRNLYLHQDENTSFTVSYKPEKESQPPVVNGFGFFVSSKEYSLDEIKNKTKAEVNQLEIFSQDKIDIKGNLSQEDYTKKVMQNRTLGTFYIYGRYYDKDSGVNKISINNTHAFSQRGSYVPHIENSKDFYFDDEATDVEFMEQDNNVIFRVKYTIPQVAQELKENDGAYNFNISVYDACGNASSEETFTALKDLYMDLSDLRVFNIYNDINTNVSDVQDRHLKAGEYINAGTYNDVIKTIKFVYAKPVYSIVEDLDAVEFSVKYINKQGQEVTEPISKNAQDKKYYEHKLDVNHVYDLKFTIIAKNNYGSTATRDFYFPPKPYKAPDCDYIILPGNTHCTTVFENVMNADGSLIIPGVFPNTITNKNDMIYFPDTDNDEQKNILIYYENEMLFSEVCDNPVRQKDDPFSILPESNSIKQPLPVKNAEFDIKDGNYILSVTLDDNIWKDNPDEWDYLLVYSNSTDDDLHYGPKELLYTKDLLTNSTILQYDDQIESKYIYVAGIKGEYRSPFSQLKYLQISDTEKQALKQELLDVQAPKMDGSASYAKSPFLHYIGNDKACDYIYVSLSGKVNDLYVTVNNTYRDTYTNKNFGTTKGSIILDLDGVMLIPIIDWQYGNNTIDVTAINETGSINKTFEFPLQKSPIIFNVNKFENNSEGLKLVSEPTTYDINTALNNGYEYGSSIYISYLDKDGWHDYTDFGPDSDYPIEKTEIEEGKYKYSITVPSDYITANGTVPSNTFVKVSTSLAYGKKSSYILFFNGSASSGNRSDELLDMEDYFLVTSNKPVYVNTVTTKCPYNDCKNWTAQEWEELHLKYNEKFMSFDNTNSGILKIYNLDTSCLQNGDCYVVIAHYADGQTKMSEVKIKE